jgi:hypothetical protein
VAADVDDSFGDFLSGVSSTSLSATNVSQPMESVVHESAGAALTNNSHLGIHDSEKSEKKGRNNRDYELFKVCCFCVNLVGFMVMMFSSSQH